MSTKVSKERRAQLLRDLASMQTDADLACDGELLTRFLPQPGHELALRTDKLVVRGERGSGKTILFRLLGALQAGGHPTDRFFPGLVLGDVEWIEGFSERDTRHPHVDNVTAFVASARPEQVRVMWSVHLARQLADGLGSSPPMPAAVRDVVALPVNEVRRWTEAGVPQLPALTGWLDACDAELRRSGRRAVVLYDHLDRIGITEPTMRASASAALLALWLSLGQRYRHIAAKVFVREDLFQASLGMGSDATKLEARSARLLWDTSSLYRLLVRHMAAESSGLRHWIQESAKAVPLSHEPPFGWFPPEVLPESGSPSQRAFVEHLAGELMGRGVRKGYVYRWIPNRLQDAHGRIAPRSLLHLIAGAAGVAVHEGPRAGYSRLLDPRELQKALESTSGHRVAELSEEHPVVRRLAHLGGEQVPVSRALAIKLLSRPGPDVDGFDDHGAAVAEALENIGVLGSRPDGRYDVADVYRYHFGIKRKGGVSRPA